MQRCRNCRIFQCELHISPETHFEDQPTLVRFITVHHCKVNRLSGLFLLCARATVDNVSVWLGCSASAVACSSLLCLALVQEGMISLFVVWMWGHESHLTNCGDTSRGVLGFLFVSRQSAVSCSRWDCSGFRYISDESCTCQTRRASQMWFSDVDSHSPTTPSDVVDCSREH